METQDRLINDRGNAMLVAGSKACVYYELFQTNGFKNVLLFLHMYQILIISKVKVQVKMKNTIFI